MRNFICVQCGTQFEQTSEPPSRCPTCEDERQYVRHGGQQWTTLNRDWCPLSELADAISSSVKSDTALPADAASAKLLANKILDVSTEKPTGVGPTPKMEAIISGKVYKFARNDLTLKSLSLSFTDPQPHWDLEAYAGDTTKSDPRITDPIRLDGLYRKGELARHGFDARLEGAPRVNAVKGTWQDDHTLLIDRLVLGLGGPADRWTLTFEGDKLNVRAKIGARPEVSIDSESDREEGEPVQFHLRKVYTTW